MPGRPLKSNLSYWHINVGIEEDRKIKQLRAAHPDKGFEILFFLWNRMYREEGYGYFIEWNPVQADLLFSEFYTTKEKMKLVIETCLEVKLFDAEIYKRHGILTSKGLQERYLFQMKHIRRIYFIKEYAIIPMDFNEKYDVDIRNKVFYLHFPDIDLIKDESGFLLSSWKEMSNSTSLVWAPSYPVTVAPNPNADILDEIMSMPPSANDPYERDSTGKIKPLPFGSKYNFEHEKAIVLSDNMWKDRMGMKHVIGVTVDGIFKSDFEAVDKALLKFFEHVKDKNKFQCAVEMQGWFDNWFPKQSLSKGYDKKVVTTNLHLPTGGRDYGSMKTF